MCEACRKHFATSDGFDKHRTSGYLLGTPCHVLDDGSTRAILVATDRQTMSTAMLQKLKLSQRTHGTLLSTLSTYPKNVSNISKISKNKSARTKPERAVIRPPPVLVLSNLFYLLLKKILRLLRKYLGIT